MFAGQVGVAGHLKVADGAIIGAKSGIAGDVKKENSVMLGYPAFEHKDFLRSSVIFRKLPDLKARLEELEKQVKLLMEK
jgi:UDP-3-O-[3-hydroxymyristoyl] glucosamine N-acyltransferase